MQSQLGRVMQMPYQGKQKASPPRLPTRKQQLWTHSAPSSWGDAALASAVGNRTMKGD